MIGNVTCPVCKSLNLQEIDIEPVQEGRTYAQCQKCEAYTCVMPKILCLTPETLKAAGVPLGEAVMILDRAYLAHERGIEAEAAKTRADYAERLSKGAVDSFEEKIAATVSGQLEGVASYLSRRLESLERQTAGKVAAVEAKLEERQRPMQLGGIIKAAVDDAVTPLARQIGDLDNHRPSTKKHWAINRDREGNMTSIDITETEVDA